MHVSRSPIARCTSTAATAESTPPERPQMARRFGPTSARILAISCSTKCPGVQSGSQRQMPNRKLWRISVPRAVCATSGWNNTPNRGRVSCRIPATGALALTAVTRKPGGGAAILSPWLAHTVIMAPVSKPAKSPAFSRMAISARPYSRSLDGVTAPPDRCASSCIP